MSWSAQVTQGLLPWIAALTPVPIAVVAGWYTLLIRRRETQQALADVHRELTTGEVAHARDVIGTMLYAPDRRNEFTRSQLIQAYFALYWCVERVDNVAQIHANQTAPALFRGNLGLRHRDHQRIGSLGDPSGSNRRTTS